MAGELSRIYKSVVVAGCGYTGRRLIVDQALRTKRTVAITNHSTIELPQVESFQIDLDHDSSCCISLDRDTVVFYLVPPPSKGSIDTRIRRFLGQVLATAPVRLVLISTTGVYGDCEGAWVTEDSPVNPQTHRAKRRHDAETFAQDWATRNGVELVVLRVPAIYGPGRVPVNRIRQGLTLPPASENGYTNRIHVDDLAAVCVAASSPSVQSGIFNVSDGCPLRMIDYLNLVADVWGLPSVNESLDSNSLEQLSPAMVEYLRESRKIDNRRMLQELSIELTYSNLRKGLEACLQHG